MGPPLIDGSRLQFEDAQTAATHWRCAERPGIYVLASLVVAVANTYLCWSAYRAIGPYHPESAFSDLSFIALVGSFLGAIIWMFTFAIAREVLSPVCRALTGKGFGGQYHFNKDQDGEIVLGLSGFSIFVAEVLWVWL